MTAEDLLIQDLRRENGNLKKEIEELKNKLDACEYIKETER